MSECFVSHLLLRYLGNIHVARYGKGEIVRRESGGLP
jgi:hypothetical protein